MVRKTSEAINAKGALLRILNLETHQLELFAAYGLSKKYLAKGHVSSEKTITDLCRLNKVIIIEDFLKDPRVQYPQEAWEEGIRMMLDLPLTIGDHIVGIIRIFFAENRKLSEEELNFVVSIAEQSSLAIDKTRLIEAQQSQYNHLVIQTEKLSALGRMAAGIAHEINNPLAGILLYATNLTKKVPAGSTIIREGLDIIIQETIRCRNIIQELLEFSREKEPKKSLININSIIEKVLNILENEFHLHHIDVEKDLSPAIPDILLDVNQIEQVFVNLLLNAIEATEGHGVIKIKSRVALGLRNVRVEIADKGTGILPEHINKIFDPFFSTKVKGTGLGLFVSYGIVQKHQGHMRVSSHPGRGTKFTIEIPLTQEASSMVEEGNEHGSQ
ncbi:MAG: GAF domain-containing protein [Desulfobacteraceae bacterium]|nr:MAG: GAF domain-containing protein [Desulfobacteraceae bacterium]